MGEGGAGVRRRGAGALLQPGGRHLDRLTEEATKWQEDEGTGGNWPVLEGAYLVFKNIPTSTDNIDRRDMNAVFEEMKKKCDVELSVLLWVDDDGIRKQIDHVVASTAMQKTKGGDYTMVVTHDAEQGKEGGTEGKEGNEEVKWGRQSWEVQGPVVDRQQGAARDRGRVPEGGNTATSTATATTATAACPRGGVTASEMVLDTIRWRPVLLVSACRRAASSEALS